MLDTEDSPPRSSGPLRQPVHCPCIFRNPVQCALERHLNTIACQCECHKRQVVIEHHPEPEPAA